MANSTKTDDIKITFKQDEKMYARIFREMYTSPSAILKDFMFSQVRIYLDNNDLMQPNLPVCIVGEQKSGKQHNVKKSQNQDDIDIVL